jgi:hypothetical protein
MSTTFEKLLIWLGKNDKMNTSKTFYEQDMLRSSRILQQADGLSGIEV